MAIPEREITGSSVGDAPMLPELLNQIHAEVEIGSVTADGAYDTRKCHVAMCPDPRARGSPAATLKLLANPTDIRAIPAG
jgi:hypothetical protein